MPPWCCGHCALAPHHGRGGVRGVILGALMEDAAVVAHFRRALAAQPLAVFEELLVARRKALAPLFSCQAQRREVSGYMSMRSRSELASLAQLRGGWCSTSTCPALCACACLVECSKTLGNKIARCVEIEAPTGVPRAPTLLPLGCREGTCGAGIQRRRLDVPPLHFARPPTPGANSWPGATSWRSRGGSRGHAVPTPPPGVKPDGRVRKKRRLPFRGSGI